MGDACGCDDVLATDWSVDESTWSADSADGSEASGLGKSSRCVFAKTILPAVHFGFYNDVSYGEVSLGM